MRLDTETLNLVGTSPVDHSHLMQIYMRLFESYTTTRLSFTVYGSALSAPSSHNVSSVYNALVASVPRYLWSYSLSLIRCCGVPHEQPAVPSSSTIDVNFGISRRHNPRLLNVRVG
jgi:hypothetical protein